MKNMNILIKACLTEKYVLKEEEALARAVYTLFATDPASFSIIFVNNNNDQRSYFAHNYKHKKFDR